MLEVVDGASWIDDLLAWGMVAVYADLHAVAGQTNVHFQQLIEPVVNDGVSYADEKPVLSSEAG